MSTRRFELDDGKSRKFWETELDGCWHIVRHGRLGTDGRTTEKCFFTPSEAKAAREKLIKQKTAKGYTEITHPGAKKSKASKKGTQLKSKLRWPKGCECHERDEYGSVFPPSLGYSPLHSDPSGGYGGDETGLYWPIGQERRQPLVVRMFHDTFELGPFFSSYQRYHRWRKVEQTEHLPHCADAKLDPDSPEVLYSQGLMLLQTKDVPNALETFERAIARLPEFTLVSSLLAKQHRRAKNLDRATEFALQSLISPPTFGRFDGPLLGWLCRQKSPPEAYVDNPVWTHRRKLQWGFRQKKNGYGIIQEAIDAFFDAGQPVLGVTLMQTYAEFMFWERDSTQRRWKFDATEWTDRQDELCVKYLKTSRWTGGSRS